MFHHPPESISQNAPKVFINATTNAATQYEKTITPMAMQRAETDMIRD